MTGKCDLTVMIPAFNEGSRLEATLATLCHVLEKTGGVLTCRFTAKDSRWTALDESELFVQVRATRPSFYLAIRGTLPNYRLKHHSL